MRPTYKAIAQRDDVGWLVRIRRERGLHTHVRQLDQAEPIIRDVIARVRDVSKDSFDVVIETDPAPAAERVEA
jgi:hypothetical protein